MYKLIVCYFKKKSITYLYLFKCTNCFFIFVFSNIDIMNSSFTNICKKYSGKQDSYKQINKTVRCYKRKNFFFNWCENKPDKQNIDCHLYPKIPASNWHIELSIIHFSQLLYCCQSREKCYYSSNCDTCSFLILH